MTSVAFAIPGDITLPTGGYAYDRRVLALLPAVRRRGPSRRAAGQLSGARPRPTSPRRSACWRTCRRETVMLVDGLAYGAMPAELISLAAQPDRRARASSAVPGGRPRQSAPGRAVRAGEGRLRAGPARHRHQPEHGPQRSATTLRSPPARSPSPSPARTRAERAKGTGKPLQLLSVGSIVPRKALDVLVRALALVPDTDWRLTIVGPTDRSAEAPDRPADGHCGDGAARPRIAVAGPADPRRLDVHYAAADVFVMPSLYEGYGMVLAEAMARRLADRVHDGRCSRRYRPGRCRASRLAPGDVQGAALGHPTRARRCRVAPSHERCGLDRRPEFAAVGGYGAHRRGRFRPSAGVAPMSGFDASWLDAARAADHRSRSEDLASCWRAALRTGASTVSVLDLGCGTGSNLRATAPWLGADSTGRSSTTTRLLLDAARHDAWRPGPSKAEKRGDHARCCTRAASASRCELRRADLAPRSRPRVWHQARSRDRVGAVRSRFGGFHLGDRAPRSCAAAQPSTQCSPTTAEVPWPGEAYDIVVGRKDLADVQVIPSAPLVAGPGQVHVAIESYALTANNITYGIAGETMKYWDFFPAAAPGMGRLPVWGFGKVRAVRPAGCGRGRAALRLLAHVQRCAADDRPCHPGRSPRRARTARSYRRSIIRTCAWRPIRAMPAGSEPYVSLIRPLFTTSFLIDDFLAESGFFRRRHRADHERIEQDVDGAGLLPQAARCGAAGDRRAHVASECRVRRRARHLRPRRHIRQDRRAAGAKGRGGRGYGWRRGHAARHPCAARGCPQVFMSRRIHAMA